MYRKQIFSLAIISVSDMFNFKLKILNDLRGLYGKKIWVSLYQGCPQAMYICGRLSKPHKLRVWNANLT